MSRSMWSISFCERNSFALLQEVQERFVYKVMSDAAIVSS